MATSITDFNKKNPNYVGNRAAYIKPEDVRRKETSKSNGKKGSGNQSWLSSIISELGGAGGALGGAAAGAAAGSVVPGIGNIVGGIAGGIIGGFGGGTGGRLLENKVRDNEYRLGDALKEGAVSGAFGAVGPSWQAYKGLGALGKAGGSAGIRGGASLLSGMSDDAAKVAGKAIVSKGAKAGKFLGQNIDNIAGMSADDLAYATRKGLQAGGGSLRSINRGIVSGNSGLSPDDVVRQNKALDGVNKWFSGIGKSKQYENADDAMKALSNTYKLSGEGAMKFGANADELVTRFISNLDSNPTLRGTLTPKFQRVVSNLADDATNIKTNGDFIEFMSKKINPLYKELKNGNPGSVQSQIYEAFREAGKSVIDEKMATRSGINKQFSNLMGATNSLGKTITRDAGAGAGQGLTLGRILSNVAGGAMDVTGRGMQQVGKVTKVTTPVAAGALARGIAGQSVAPMAQDPSQELDMNNPEDVMAYNEMNAAPTMESAQVGQTTEDGTAPSQSMQQPTEVDFRSALQQAQEILGNNATSAQYLAYAKAIMAESKPDKVAVKAQDAVASGGQALNIIDQLEQAYQSAGGGQGRIAGTISSLGGKAGLSNEVNIYNDAKLGFLSNVARSLGEKGVITDYDIERIAKLFPSPSSNPQEASAKWGMIRTIISNGIAKNQEAYGGNQYQPDQTDLASLIQEGAY